MQNLKSDLMNRGISKRQAEPEKCFLDKGIKTLQSAKHR